MKLKLFFAAAVAMIAGLGQAQTKAPPIQEVNLYVSRNVAPAPKIRVQINTRNLANIKVTLSKIDALAWLRQDPEIRSKLKPTGGKKVQEFQVNMLAKGQYIAPPPQENYFSKQINMMKLPPGVYLLESSSASRGERWVVITVTNLAVQVKRSPKRVLSWVTDFKTGSIVTGAKIYSADKAGKLTTLGNTDADGIHQAELRPGTERILVQRGTDYAEIESQGMNPDGVLKAHIQTDRPIYRPGQTLYYKGIMRLTAGQGYTAMVGTRFEVELRDPRDTLIDRQFVTSNEIGSVTGQFDLPSEGALGGYSLVFKNGQRTAYHSLAVQAYRKPEYKVTVTPTARRALAGETVVFKVKAEYYFGASVPQAQIDWTARSSASYFSSGSADDWAYNGDGNLYPRDTYGNDPFSGSGRIYTDNKGEATIEIKTDPNAPDSTYYLNLTVMDGSRRQVEGSASIPVYAAEVRIGLSTELLAIPLGKLIPVDIRLADLDGQPVGGTVNLKLVGTAWDEKKNISVDVLHATQTVNVTAGGRARTNLPAKAVGSLRVVAETKDRTGRVTRDTMWVYVSGPFTKTEREEQGPVVTIRLDKRSYLPGDTINTYVTTNQGPRPILMTVEGEDLWSYRVLRPKAKQDSISWAIPTAAKHVPNLVIHATQWTSDGYALSANQWVYLYDRNRQLKVEVTPDKTEYQPGDKATYMVKTTDMDGKATSAEVALSVVDEAIFALMPDSTADMFRTYWGRRDNKVLAFESAPEEVSGGAYQRANAPNVPVRQRFEDTAYWNAVVQTDESGRATITFEVPGNLTTWRTTARAVTGDTRVGMVRGSVVATRPVTLRLASPRQMVVGDQISLFATVNNRTNEPRRMRVDLIVDGQTRSQELTIEPGVEGRVQFPVTAQKLGTIALEGRLFDADGTAQDALIARVPVVPDGVETRIIEAGQTTGPRQVMVGVPADAIPGAGSTIVRVWPGVGEMVATIRAAILQGGRYATLPTASQIRLAALGDFSAYRKEMLEANAYLSRAMTNGGWGYWEGDNAHSWATAYVLEALVEGQKAEGKVEIPRIDPEMIQGAAASLERMYARTNLWEHRAIMAVALKAAGHPKADTFLAEVKERGLNLSPYARIRLALATNNDQLLNEVVAEVSRGATSFLPVGDGIGWYASDFETNAWLLLAMAKRNIDRDLQGSILRHLLQRQSGWSSPMERTALAMAIHAYVGGNVQPTTISSASVKVGEASPVTLTKSNVDNSYSATLPGLGAGSVPIQMDVQANGEVFYQIEARVFRPLANETQTGVRVLRRIEVRNENGIWKELDRDIVANEPVRITALVWGDSLEDPIRIVEPIPAGFEFLEDDWTSRAGRSEVRDGSVTHYVNAVGLPITYRYFLRAETDGKLIVPPAIAEVMRRPASRGQSRREEIRVVAPPPPR